MGSIWSNFQGESPFLQAVGKCAAFIYDERDLLQMYLHMMLSALFPIVVGAHASLVRPPSAAPPEKDISEEDETDELEDVVRPKSEPDGLTPSDAILFPVAAGATLTVLYFIIKWTKDARILNKVLGYYFSVFGVFGVGRLAKDILNVVTSLIFPSVWTSGQRTYFIDSLLCQQVFGPVSKSGSLRARKNPEDKTNPFPGFLSGIKFPTDVEKTLWACRALFRKHWIFRSHVQGLFSNTRKVYLNDVIGLMTGFVTIILYNTVGQTWWLTNAIGFGFGYGAIQLMSLTTFWTGTLVLSGLFVYDIVMVFYTPMMITVATKLEVPVKLVFPGPGRGSMLGLGDVVLPGIMMAFALRFDLYLHYLYKQRKRADLDSTSSTLLIKAPYVDANGQWGDLFWTQPAVDAESITKADGARFPKVYFKASVIGYVLALTTTVVVMLKYNHGQPALLYLVPGILLSLWGTGLVRGQLKLMWEYTEDGIWGFEDDKKPQPVKEKKVETPKVEDGSADNAKKSDAEHSQHVFLFSLSAPLAKKAKSSRRMSIKHD